MMKINEQNESWQDGEGGHYEEEHVNSKTSIGAQKKPKDTLANNSLENIAFTQREEHPYKLGKEETK